MKICFLASSIEHVRYRKRIELLRREGVKTITLGFKRNSYPGKHIPGEVICFDAIQHRNYLNRIVPFLKSLSKIRQKIKQVDVVYAFSLDMLFLGWLGSLFNVNNYIVYEVGDIREVLVGQGLKQRLFRLLEKYLLKRTDLLVITSKAYLTGYFLNMQGLKDIDYLVVENKLDRNWLVNHTKVEKNSDSPLVIGYFGVLRCRRSFDILKTIARAGAGDFRVYLRGISGDLDLEEESKGKYITYEGPYLAPDDLPEIYGKVDMVWACYPYQGNKVGNWQWAKTVRFYEACFFKKPVIVQAGTEDSKMVEQYNIGLIIDMNEGIDRVAKKVQGITPVDLKRWQNNMKNLPEQVYLYTDEHERLLELLSR